MVPTVSVIVPVYNCQKYISECLTSLVNQTYPNVEIVIVNDGSTDASESIILEYIKKHDQIKYFYQDNSGPSEARNKAIINTTGEYLVFIDSDDTVDQQYIESLLSKMVNTGADLVCCGYTDISLYGKVHHTDFNFRNNVSLHSFIEMVCKGTGGVLWGKIYKKEIILKNELMMDKNLFMSEDLVFVLKYAIHCKGFGTIKEYLYNYNRLNQDSISTNKSMKYIKNHITVCEYLEEILTSVYFDEEKITNIISGKLQDLVVNLVEQQSVNLKAIGWKNAIENVYSILSIEYIKKYKKYFSTKKIIYIPYIYIIKNNLVRTSILYGIYLKHIKSIRRTLKGRKEVIL